jgi:hypothetical protein
MNAGIPVELEPRVNERRTKPDLEIMLERGRLLVDVSVVHSPSPSYIQNQEAAMRAYTPLERREAAKVSKYAQLAVEAKANFLPFVVSSFGGFGRAAERIIALLRESVQALPAMDWCEDPVAELVRDLSIILQRGNAQTVIEGCQRAGVAMRVLRPVQPRVVRGGVAAAAAPGGARGQANGINEADDDASDSDED